MPFSAASFLEVRARARSFAGLAAFRAWKPPLSDGEASEIVEGARVSAAIAAMEHGDLAGFGTLMDASHTSLRDDYDVSSRELDRLVEVAREGGAAGARLTGAGFGGCIVALAPADAADVVLSELRERFYGPRGVQDPGESLFVAEPSAGAGVERM